MWNRNGHKLPEWLACALCLTSCGPVAIGGAIAASGGEDSSAAPTLVVNRTVPADGSQSVDPDVVLRLEFSESLDAVDVKAVELLDSSGTRLDVDVAVLGDVLLVTPLQPLRLLADHVLALDPSRIRSLAGSSLDGITPSISFRVRDGSWFAETTLASAVTSDQRLWLALGRSTTSGLFVSWSEFEFTTNGIANAKWLGAYRDRRTGALTAPSLLSSSEPFDVALSTNQAGKFGYVFQEASGSRSLIYDGPSERLERDEFLPAGAEDAAVSANESGTVVFAWEPPGVSDVLEVELVRSGSAQRSTFSGVGITWSSWVSSDGDFYFAYSQGGAPYEVAVARLRPDGLATILPPTGAVLVGGEAARVELGPSGKPALYEIEPQSIRVREWDEATSAWMPWDIVAAYPPGQSVRPTVFIASAGGAPSLLTTVDAGGPERFETRVVTFTRGLGWNAPGLLLGRSGTLTDGLWLAFSHDGAGGAAWGGAGSASNEIRFSRFRPDTKWSSAEQLGVGAFPTLTLDRFGRIILLYSSDTYSSILLREFR